VKSRGLAVQRAAAHCLNATIALHQDLAKFITATLPQVLKALCLVVACLAAVVLIEWW